MILIWLIAVPFAAAVLAWLAGQRSRTWPRWIALAGIAVDLGLAIAIWARAGAASAADPWLVDLNLPWIDALGIRFHLALDGLSLLLILLTGVLGLVSVAASWREIQDRVGFFHFHLLWVLAGIIGVFTAVDLFVFYFFWEMMLAPMYFLIGIWGHERRIYAAVKFFIFTQISGLLMLIAIVALYVIHGRATRVYTFDYQALLGTPLSPAAGWWLMLGFFGAFAVKLPILPVHTWLPDAHTEAPTAGSVILAGLLLKTGAYGLIRFVVPLFQATAISFAPIAIGLGVAGALYGAVLAFGQTDLKRLVAYTSVSHMGFVLIGVFAGTSLAMQGAVLQMLCHGVSTGALFVLVGALQDRLHTRDLRQVGGLWPALPRLGGTTLFFALASMGLPGLGNFLAEFLVLVGTWRVSPVATAIASIALIVSTVYALWMVQAAFQGPPRGAGAAEPRAVPDLGRREMAVGLALILAIVWLGVYPQPFVDVAAPAVDRVAASLTASAGQR
jgi:NADH-quinone oxidoreductase subunit M